MAEVLFNRYEVVEALRSTDHSTSYKVVDPDGVTVFLKRVKAEPAQADIDLRAIRRLMGVQHPQVATPIAAETTDDGYYYVREWVAGNPLRTTGERRLDPDGARALIAEVCTGVGAIHTAGAAHGNLSPSNIIRRTDGVIVVVDGGVHRRTDYPAAAPPELGQYVAPEQAQGMSVRPQTDVYLLGVMLYELLTGRHPFEGPDARSVMDSHRVQPLPKPSLAVERVTPDLDEIVARATAKSPPQRYADAAALRQALARKTEAEGRSPWWWTSAIVAALVVLLAIILLSGGDETAIVPDVTGMPIADAEAALTEAGFETGDITEEGTADAEPGVVLSQNPEADTEADVDSAVDLTVSSLPDVEIPDVTGLSEAEATARLGQEGLRIGDIDRQESEDVEAGFVISQDPAAAQTVTVGQEVNLVVSQGPAPEDGVATVPNVVGLEEDTAVSTLEAAGFRVRSREVEGDQPAGTVVTQDPAAETEAESGDRVTIEISEGPPEQATVPDLVGMNVLEAWREVRNADLDIDYDWVQEGAPYLEVLTQDPEPGSQMNQGEEVVVTVSVPSAGDIPGLGGDEPPATDGG